MLPQYKMAFNVDELSRSMMGFNAGVYWRLLPQAQFVMASSEQMMS